MKTESELQASMNLPVGFTCADCRHIPRCKALFGCDETNSWCDWAPSRFSMSTVAAQKAQKQSDLAACDEVADLYGEDSERGLAAAEIKRRILKNG